jgi:hypothetical protein
MKYIAGLDLGQSADPTALVIAEQLTVEVKEDKEQHAYHIRHVERFPLGTSYPSIVKQVKDILERPSLMGMVTLALDYTGVGRPVADMFEQARLSCPIYAVSIHGGDAVNWDPDQKHVRVPKRDLVAVVQVLLQSERLKIADSLPQAPILIKELLNFRVKIDPLTAHDSYAAWREGMHDDLVLATALACWIGEELKGEMFAGFKAPEAFKRQPIEGELPTVRLATEEELKRAQTDILWQGLRQHFRRQR